MSKNDVDINQIVGYPAYGRKGQREVDFMRFEELEKSVRKLRVMNDRADVSFADIEYEHEKRIDFKRLWVVIDKGYQASDYITMHLHVSRFNGDDIKVRVKIAKIDDYKEQLIYKKNISIDTISSANDFIECAIQAFIA